MQSLIDKLETFVKAICKDRDYTHGFEHAQKVAKISIVILMHEYQMIHEYQTRYIPSIYVKDVLIVAYLHDVADHKYDKDGTLREQLRQFMKDELELPQGLIEWYLDIIDRVSYSREVKHGDHDWKKALTDYGIEIRNIVSDADKLEAIGQIGIDRCRKYIIDHNPNISQDELDKKIREHADEKLLKIKDNFIRTKTGKIMAEPLHAEMIEILQR